MSLTERPQGWHVTVPLPESGDFEGETKTEIRLELAQPVRCGKTDYPLLTPLTVTAAARRTPLGARVSIGLAFDVATQCRRCGAELEEEIREDYIYDFVLSASDDADGGDDGSFAEESVEIPVTHIGSGIDITDQIWECLIVSLPMYSQCPDGCEDAPEAPESGIDPRFQVLADALEQDKESKMR